MANEPESQKPEVSVASKSRPIVVNRGIAVAALLAVALLAAAVTYTVAYSVSLTTCRRVSIPATDSADCLDAPPACSLASWNSVTGCSIVVDPSCICYQGQTRSCVMGGPGMPSELCTPGSATCGVKYCQQISGTWTWESDCHPVP
jgi:hypothetical protein